MIINASIDVTKVDKTKLKPGREKNGKVPQYLDITLLENRDGIDSYGNDGMVVQSTTKEERAAGKRGTILGNYKLIGIRPETEDPGHDEGKADDTTDDDVPF